jgi:hypothetical protein
MPSAKLRRWLDSRRVRLVVVAAIVAVILWASGRRAGRSGWELVLDRPIHGKYEDLAFPTDA